LNLLASIDPPVKSATLAPDSAPALSPSFPQARSATTPAPSPFLQAVEPTFQTTAPVPFPIPDTLPTNPVKRNGTHYEPRERSIERLTMRQLGEATPDVMHPFFMKKAGFNLEDALPQYVHEYATSPLEEIMEILLKIYSRQLKTDKHLDD